MNAARLFILLLAIGCAANLHAAMESDPRLQADGKGWSLEQAKITNPSRPRVLLIGDSIEYHVSPAGDDANSGAADRPLATIDAARRTARSHAGRQPMNVLLHAGIYYLPETLKFTAEDSGTAQAPIVYAAAPGEQPVLSGGVRLTLDWKPFRGGIVQAQTPAGLAMDQLFVNGQRQHMARYPNYDTRAQQFKDRKSVV